MKSLLTYMKWPLAGRTYTNKLGFSDFYLISVEPDKPGYIKIKYKRNYDDDEEFTFWPTIENFNRDYKLKE